MYLGVKAVFAKSFARMRHANLVNFGILPLVLADDDYDAIQAGDRLELAGVPEAIGRGDAVSVKNLTQGTEFVARHRLTPRQVEIVLEGGLLNFVKSRSA